MHKVLENALIAWRSGWRSNGARLIGLLGLLLVASAFLAGAFSLRQPMIVAMDIGFTGMRILAVLLGLFWVQEVIAKDIERRTILFALAYPFSRASYLLGRFVGVAALVLVALAGFALLVLAMVSVSSWGYEASSRPDLGLAYWLAVLGIFLDVVLVVAVAIWLSTLAETPFLPLLVGLGFAIAGHAIGPVLDYLMYSPYADQKLVEHHLPWLQALRWVLPDLSRLDWRVVPLYGQVFAPTTFVYCLSLVAGYSTMLLSLSFIHFSRREFK